MLLCIEAMAQLGGIAAATDEGGGGILAAIDRAELREAPAPGDSLIVTVRVVRAFGPLNLIEGRVSADGRVLADATMTLRVGRTA